MQSSAPDPNARRRQPAAPEHTARPFGRRIDCEERRAEPSAAARGGSLRDPAEWERSRRAIPRS